MDNVNVSGNSPERSDQDYQSDHSTASISGSAVRITHETSAEQVRVHLGIPDKGADRMISRLLRDHLASDGMMSENCKTVAGQKSFRQSLDNLLASGAWHQLSQTYLTVYAATQTEQGKQALYVMARRRKNEWAGRRQSGSEKMNDSQEAVMPASIESERSKCIDLSPDMLREDSFGLNPIHSSPGMTGERPSGWQSGPVVSQVGMPAFSRPTTLRDETQDDLAMLSKTQVIPQRVVTLIDWNANLRVVCSLAELTSIGRPSQQTSTAPDASNDSSFDRFWDLLTTDWGYRREMHVVAWELPKVDPRHPPEFAVIENERQWTAVLAAMVQDKREVLKFAMKQRTI